MSLAGRRIADHDVTEHEDGTITWHGYLERGLWREV